MKRFKIYRWWKGGRWVFSHGEWWPVLANGFVDHPGRGYHYTFVGIEKREDYRSADEVYWNDMMHQSRQIFDKHCPSALQRRLANRVPKKDCLGW